MNYLWKPSDLYPFKTEDYDEFHFLVHGTHITTTHDIMKKQQMEIQNPTDFTRVTFPVLWFAGSNNANPRYGGVVFIQKVSWLTEKKFCFYFVENIDYAKSQTATRILCTENSYDQFIPYDPYKEGGIWWIKDDKHFTVRRRDQFKNNGDDSREHVLEFVFDESINLDDLFHIQLQPYHRPDCKKKENNKCIDGNLFCPIVAMCQLMVYPKFKDKFLKPISDYPHNIAGFVSIFYRNKSEVISTWGKEVGCEFFDLLHSVEGAPVEIADDLILDPSSIKEVEDIQKAYVGSFNAARSKVKGFLKKNLRIEKPDANRIFSAFIRPGETPRKCNQLDDVDINDIYTLVYRYGSYIDETIFAHFMNKFFE